MSIFGERTSLFSERRSEVNRHYENCDHFYSSWFLLRIDSQKIIEKSKGRCHHWQRDFFVCHAKGRARKGRKNHPKNHKHQPSIQKQAMHWAIRNIPLTL
jgi:hypothetical protein